MRLWIPVLLLLLCRLGNLPVGCSASVERKTPSAQPDRFLSRILDGYDQTNAAQDANIKAVQNKLGEFQAKFQELEAKFYPLPDGIEYEKKHDILESNYIFARNIAAALIAVVLSGGMLKRYFEHTKLAKYTKKADTQEDCLSKILASVDDSLKGLTKRLDNIKEDIKIINVQLQNVTNTGEELAARIQENVENDTTLEKLEEIKMDVENLTVQINEVKESGEQLNGWIEKSKKKSEGLGVKLNNIKRSGEGLESKIEAVKENITKRLDNNSDNYRSGY